MTQPIYPTANSLKTNDALTEYGKEIYSILDKVIAKSKEWFDETKTDRDNRVDENYICGFEIEGHCFDIDIWDGQALSDDGQYHCQIIECFDDGQYHSREDRGQYLWSVGISEVTKRR